MLGCGDDSRRLPEPDNGWAAASTERLWYDMFVECMSGVMRGLAKLAGFEEHPFLSAFDWQFSWEGFRVWRYVEVALGVSKQLADRCTTGGGLHAT